VHVEWYYAMGLLLSIWRSAFNLQNPAIMCKLVRYIAEYHKNILSQGSGLLFMKIFRHERNI